MKFKKVMLISLNRYQYQEIWKDEEPIFSQNNSCIYPRGRCRLDRQPG